MFYTPFFLFFSLDFSTKVFSNSCWLSMNASVSKCKSYLSGRSLLCTMLMMKMTRMVTMDRVEVLWSSLALFHVFANWPHCSWLFLVLSSATWNIYSKHVQTCYILVFGVLVLIVRLILIYLIRLFGHGIRQNFLKEVRKVVSRISIEEATRFHITDQNPGFTGSIKH